MQTQNEMDHEFVLDDVLLITDFQQTNMEEQVKNAKDEAEERVLHIHYGCDYIGVAILNKRGSLGCFSCYERQYNINNNFFLESNDQNKDYGIYEKKLENMYARQIANIIATSLIQLSKGKEVAYIIYGNASSVDKIYIKKIENCMCCGTMRKDEAAHMDFEIEEFFGDKESFRLKKEPNLDKMKKELIMYRAGMFQHVYRYYKSPYIPILCAEFNDVMSGRRIRSFGRSFHSSGVETSALLEGLERYSAMLPRRWKSDIRKTEREIGKNGVIPERFVLHEREDLEEYGITKYDKNRPINWTWAYSWKKKKPILIPEQIAYFDINKYTKEKRFVYETSNGVSLGGSLQEAVLYGLYELIERDAFLLCWYNRHQPTKIELSSIKDKKVLDTIWLVEANGYKIHIFDITTENRVPAVWILLENPNPKAKVRSYTSAGAHSNPYKAIESGLVEAITSMPIYENIMPAEEERAHLLNRDFRQVTKMEDHVLMYSVPESFEHLHYLFEKEEYQTIEELYPWWEKEKEKESLTKTLEKIVKRILESHEDIYIVDQGNDLIERYGFHCAKVIIPSMLTMYFGEQFKRMNTERVCNGAVLSGWRKKPIDVEDICQTPHPFP